MNNIWDFHYRIKDADNLDCSNLAFLKSRYFDFMDFVFLCSPFFKTNEMISEPYI